MVTTPSLFLSIFWNKKGSRLFIDDTTAAHLRTLYITRTLSVIFLQFGAIIKQRLDLEEALHVFSRSVVLHCGICVLPHHVIDGFHDVQHLLESEGQLEKNTDDI